MMFENDKCEFIHKRVCFEFEFLLFINSFDFMSF